MDKTPIKKWIHIDLRAGDPWILPIWGAIHKAVEKGRMKKPGKKMEELGLYVSIRLNMLPFIVKRINNECNDLYEKIRDRNKSKPEDYVFEKDKNGYAFEIDNNLKFNLLIDIDSLFFELNSCCDLITKEIFLYLYNHTGGNEDKKSITIKIQDIIKNGGYDTGWFVKLDGHRNFFMHHGAPFIAIDLTNEPSYDLLILKENIRTFDDHDKFIRLSELDGIVNGFITSKNILQKHLIDYINSL